ncbi:MULTISPECIES: response regulator [unclassified Phenylobacterium]|uniref:response regulator n=1 Tax=unclassified Phenylobacterium TaxID=2640670 RepID=UPI002264AEC3|nr:response regulator [Phenylobacterium sp. 58.2.17]MCX7585476.1 response regulator [Phenylobacterium sp. 58.2.17]
MTQGLGALRILVVDDNEQMRTIVGTVLAAAGVGRLFYATDGRHGLDQLMHNPVDVAYVDYEMPTMNGLDFISRVRMLPGDARYLPIVMLTGHSDLPRLNAARDRGVNEFLAKPVTARDILKRLESVILRPRPYVAASDFFGPDRRRRSPIGYAGPMRRAADHAGVLEL